MTITRGTRRRTPSGSGVTFEKPGGTGRLRQAGQVADYPTGIEEGVGASRPIGRREPLRAAGGGYTRSPAPFRSRKLVAKDEGTPARVAARARSVSSASLGKPARSIRVPSPAGSPRRGGQSDRSGRVRRTPCRARPPSRPPSRIRSRRRAIRYRGHGHWPRRSRLVSSRSTIAIGPGAGGRGADRRKES